MFVEQVKITTAIRLIDDLTTTNIQTFSSSRGNFHGEFARNSRCN